MGEERGIDPLGSPTTQTPRPSLTFPKNGAYAGGCGVSNPSVGPV